MTKKLRFDILERDGFTCNYCGLVAEEIDLEIDHVHPKSQGGSDDPDNLVTACSDCNRGKRARVGVSVYAFTEAEAALRLDLLEAARSLYAGMHCATFHIMKVCVARLRKSDDDREVFIAEEIDRLAESIPVLFPSPIVEYFGDIEEVTF